MNLPSCVNSRAFHPSTADIISLPYGAALIHQELPLVPTVTVDVWLPAGAVRDPQTVLGAAHMVEHMIFRGSERLRPQDFDRLIERHGGQSGAATSLEYAHYQFTVATEHFEPSWAALAELLTAATFAPAEWDLERPVILEELSQAIADPDWVLYQGLMETAFSDHPYARSVLGDSASVQQTSAAELRQFHRTHYSPHQWTVVVVGAVSRERAIAALTEGVPRCSRYSCPPMLQPASCPVQGVRRDEICHPVSQTSTLMMGWITPGATNLRAILGLELLSVILGEGRSSRLVSRLREERQWVHDIGSGFLPHQYAGVFVLRAELELRYGAIAEQQILEELWRLHGGLILEHERQRAVRSLYHRFLFGMESPAQLAEFLGYYGMLGCHHLCRHWPNAYRQEMESITVDELQSLARRYLPLESYTVISLQPSPYFP
ncbi:MAG: insulinase family protein [Oscillatoriales cyanobacterium SM2_2_1]|nr:insulinase family protein [Oscillatoriales cyanobacterium SM2_2_1]